MAKLPNGVVFTCNECHRRYEADALKGAHILPWMRRLPIDERGACRKCGGKLWTLSVLYVEESLDLKPAQDFATIAVFGGSIFAKNTHVSQRDFVDVPCHIVAEMNRVPAQRLARVAEYARARERQELIERGAIECRACSTLFMPTAGKVWSEQGYCSKMCCVDSEGADGLVSFAEPEAATAPPSNTIAVQCAAGHRFEVSMSFKGLRRPCPVCGSKTLVP